VGQDWVKKKMRRMNFNSFPQAICMVGGDIGRLMGALE